MQFITLTNKDYLVSIDLGFKRARKVFFRRSYKIVILNKMWHSPNDTSGTLFGRWKPGKSKDDCMYFRTWQKHIEKSFEYEN